MYSRAFGLQASARDTTAAQDLVGYELAPFPMPMFTETGEMRTAKNKSVLKNTLQKECSLRGQSEEIKTVVIDGSAVLYTIGWPKPPGTVNDYITKFRKYIEYQLSRNDVYLIFDRYRDFSAKSVTRSNRGAGLTHTLTLTMPMPPRESILGVAQNKKQIIQLIVDDLQENIKFPSHCPEFRRLIVTGDDPTPMEITRNAKIPRGDLKTTHEEADNIIAQQMTFVAKHSTGGISVISDDTDVFVLLLYLYKKHNMKNKVIMESPIQEGRTIVDIRATVKEHDAIINSLPAAHALTGCDTTASYHGIGKATAVKILRKPETKLDSVGEVNADMKLVIEESTKFVGACYNVPNANSLTDMTTARKKVWCKKVAKSSCAPKLNSLPPTTQSFNENVKRAHLQACIWKNADKPDPPKIDPTKCGWEKNESDKTLEPIMVPKDTLMAPEDILKLLKCFCQSETACRSRRCKCYGAGLPCTIFCVCGAELACCNPQTIHK